MEARRKGNWVAAFCAALCLLTTFAAGAWAGDAASFVSKAVADNITVTEGTKFTQTWTIKNTGTKTWDSDYKLRYMNGDLSSSHSSIKISGKVKPGNTYTFSMEMKAPAAKSSEKAYREEWKFGKSSDSTLTTLWTQIVVPAVIVDDYGDSCDKATVIGLNSSKNGKIDFAGDNDYFSVQVSSKGTLTVETTGDTDTYGRLLDSSCKEIENNDDDGKGDNFKISKKVSAGTYYVAVRHHSSTKTGSYTLNVGSVVNNDSTVAQAMTNAKNNLNKISGTVVWDSVRYSGVWADATYTYCARFVRMCLGEFNGRFADAISMYNHFNGLGLVKKGTNPPEGAAVFYAVYAPENGKYGHVGIANGAGQSYSVISRTKGVQLRNVTGAFKAAYLGYVPADVFKTYYSK